MSAEKHSPTVHSYQLRTVLHNNQRTIAVKLVNALNLGYYCNTILDRCQVFSVGLRGRRTLFFLVLTFRG